LDVKSAKSPWRLALGKMFLSARLGRAIESV
jgi:hypothetical protein